MAKWPVGILEFRRSGQIMVGTIQGDLLYWFVDRTCVEVLQTWREAAHVSRDIEEIHRAVELVVGSVKRAETLEGFVLDHSDLSMVRSGEICISTEIVVAGIE